MRRFLKVAGAFREDRRDCSAAAAQVSSEPRDGWALTRPSSGVLDCAGRTRELVQRGERSSLPVFGSWPVFRSKRCSFAIAAHDAHILYVTEVEASDQVTLYITAASQQAWTEGNIEGETAEGANVNEASSRES
jgi:hypothetical protein